MKGAILLGILSAVACCVSASDKVVFCYYGTWATYRPGLGRFDVDNINPFLCTHILYSFVGIISDGTINFLDPLLDLPYNLGRNNIGKFNDLKRQNPNLKTILAVGGYNEGSARYSIMAASPILRRTFIKSAIKVIKHYGFDGLDMDWEYPNGRDTVYGRADVENFTKLLKEIKEAFKEYGFILTAATGATPALASSSYDIAGISRYVDYVGLMAYDFFGSWNTETGHNAALFRGIGDDNIPDSNLLTVQNSIQYWLNNGCPAEKLVLGLPLYGRTFTLANPSLTSVRAPSTGAGLAGPFTRQAGMIGYNEICEQILEGGWDVRYDDRAKVPYAVKGRNWLSYDDPNSIELKVEYSQQYNLAGVMVWSIETDDFHGSCGEGDFPLLRRANSVLNRIDNSTTTTIRTTTTTEAESSESEEWIKSTSAPSSTASTIKDSSTEAPKTSTSSPSTVKCKKEGMIPNPEDCKSFFVCTYDGSKTLHPTKFYCPTGLFFNPDALICDFPDLSRCSVKKMY